MKYLRVVCYDTPMKKGNETNCDWGLFALHKWSRETHTDTMCSDHGI